jgi:hypothetical protein
VPSARFPPVVPAWSGDRQVRGLHVRACEPAGEFANARQDRGRAEQPIGMPSQVTVAAKGPSAGAIEGDQAHRSERCQDRSRTVPAASARLRWHLKYCVGPGGYTFTRTLDHGGLDLNTPMFAPCLLGRPSTGRQDAVLTSLRFEGLRYSFACHGIPVTQVFKKCL